MQLHRYLAENGLSSAAATIAPVVGSDGTAAIAPPASEPVAASGIDVVRPVAECVPVARAVAEVVIDLCTRIGQGGRSGAPGYGSLVVDAPSGSLPVRRSHP